FYQWVVLRIFHGSVGPDPVTVHKKAQGITAESRESRMTSHGRFIAGRTIDACGADIAEQDTALEVARASVGLRIADDPRARLCPKVTSDIRWQRVIVIVQIHEPCSFELFEITHTGNGLPSGFCFGQSWHEQ